MENKVNISKIARDLDLSVSTVSRALSGNGRISEYTKKRISEYIADREIVPNIRIRQYCDICTRTVSVALPQENGYARLFYFYNIFLTVYDYFSIRGYQVNLIKISPEDITNLRTAVENHVMDGVILVRTVSNHDEITLLKEHGVPFVLIGTIDDPSVLQVDVDTEAAACEITGALLHRGLNRIAVMCANKDHEINKRRLNGILKAHVENHMLLDRSFLFYDTETPNVAELAVERILAAGMDCILCMDDNIAIIVLRLLKRMKVAVPEQIRLASLHNNEMLDDWYPTVSCIYYDVGELGREASRMLYMLLTEKVRLPKSLLGHELQMKESTN